MYLLQLLCKPSGKLLTEIRGFLLRQRNGASICHPDLVAFEVFHLPKIDHKTFMGYRKSHGGKPLSENPAVKSVTEADGFVTVEIGSGKYDFFAAE